MSKDITASYKFYTDNCHVVVAICTYGDTKVDAIAKCSPNSEFDFKKGKALAQARCEAKIAALHFTSKSAIFN